MSSHMVYIVRISSGLFNSLWKFLPLSPSLLPPLTTRPLFYSFFFNFFPLVAAPPEPTRKEIVHGLLLTLVRSGMWCSQFIITSNINQKCNSWGTFTLGEETLNVIFISSDLKKKITNAFFFLKPNGPPQQCTKFPGATSSLIASFE